MIVLIILEHSYFWSKNHRSLHQALFHHRLNQKDIITSMLTNTRTDFALVPTTKHFTVINSPETAMAWRMWFVAAVRWSFYTAIPTSLCGSTTLSWAMLHNANGFDQQWCWGALKQAIGHSLLLISAVLAPTGADRAQWASHKNTAVVLQRKLRVHMAKASWMRIGCPAFTCKPLHEPYLKDVTK